MKHFLNTEITKLPATAAPGETLESLNEKRNAARLANDRELRAALKSSPSTPDLDELEKIEVESHLLFHIYVKGYYNR